MRKIIFIAMNKEKIYVKDLNDYQKEKYYNGSAIIDRLLKDQPDVYETRVMKTLRNKLKKNLIHASGDLQDAFDLTEIECFKARVGMGVHLTILQKMRDLWNNSILNEFQRI